MQVSFEVLDDLSLRFRDEAEAGAVARQPGERPIANEPAYHSGLSRLVRPPSSWMRVAHHARWSVSSRAASINADWVDELPATAACPWYRAWAATSPE